MNIIHTHHTPFLTISDSDDWSVSFILLNHRIQLIVAGEHIMGLPVGLHTINGHSALRLMDARVARHDCATVETQDPDLAWYDGQSGREGIAVELLAPLGADASSQDTADVRVKYVNEAIRPSVAATISAR
jgi:hypothetical protein